MVVMPSLRIERLNASAPSTEPPSESNAMVMPSSLLALAKASKSLGVSEVMAFDADTQVRPIFATALRRPFRPDIEFHRLCARIGRRHRLVTGGKQQASGGRACGGNESNHPKTPASGTMPERTPASRLAFRGVFPASRRINSCKSRTDSIRLALLYGDRFRSSAIWQRSDRVRRGARLCRSNDDVDQGQP